LEKLNTLFEISLDPPADEEISKLPVERAVEAYQDAMKFSGKKQVIVFQ
jgi:hypothetical protein